MIRRSLGLVCLLLAAGCGGQSSLTTSPDATTGTSTGMMPDSLTQVSFKVPGMT